MGGAVFVAAVHAASRACAPVAAVPEGAILCSKPSPPPPSSRPIARQRRGLSHPPSLPLPASIVQAVPDKSWQVSADDEDVQKAKDFALKEIIKLSDRLTSMLPAPPPAPPPPPPILASFRHHLL